MKISVELTLSPLKDDFEPLIKQFIKQLRDSGLTIIENPLSTQVYGEYDEVWGVLTDEVKSVFELMEHGVLFIKIVTSDRHTYEPSF